MSRRQSFAHVIAAQAAATPDRIVVTSDHEGVAVTAAELDTMTDRLAGTYRSRGVTHNSLVTVSLPTGIHFVLACIAIWKAGATPNPVPPDLADDDRAAVQALAAPALVVDGEPQTPQTPLEPVAFGTSAAPVTSAEPPADSWKAVVTSGSTGTPKLVLATAPALIDPTRPVAPFLPLGATQLVCAPLWHSAQFTYAFRGLLTGHHLVLTDHFDEHRFGELVERYRATWTMLYPNGIHRLVRTRDDSDLSSLDTLLHLGARCAPADKNALIARLGPQRVVEVYAGSESNGLTMITGEQWLNKPGSVGQPIGGTEIRIQADDGSSVGSGEIGQIWMRRGGDPVYVYRGAASRRPDTGWDTLGDLGYVDADGYLFVVDRAADAIPTDAGVLYPSQIEHVLLGHPGVRDAVVLDAGGGIDALVEVDDGDFDTRSLLDYIRLRVTPAQLPSQIAITRTPLRNSAGKVRRSALRVPRPRTTNV